jgi:hypothetical protein
MTLPPSRTQRGHPPHSSGDSYHLPPGGLHRTQTDCTLVAGAISGWPCTRPARNAVPSRGCRGETGHADKTGIAFD